MIIQHRFHKQHTYNTGTVEEIILKRRETSLNSSIARHAVESRENCTQIGNPWVADNACIVKNHDPVEVLVECPVIIPQ